MPRPLLGLERRRPRNVVLAPGHDPAEPGLQRGDAGAELVAVQRQPGFEPQRVAGAEPGRRDAGRERAPPTSRRRGRPARRSRRPPRPCSRCRRRCTATPSTSACATRNRPTAAARGTRGHAVDRAAGPARRARRGSCVVVAARRWRHGRASVFDAFGITSNTSRLVRVPPDDDVVEHRAVGLVEEVGVLGPPGGDLAEVVGERPLQARRARRGPATRTVPRWRDVEHHRAVAARQVLGDRAGGVLERHLPAAERHHLGAELRGGRRRAASARAVTRSDRAGGASPARVGADRRAAPAGLRSRPSRRRAAGR